MNLPADGKQSLRGWLRNFPAARMVRARFNSRRNKIHISGADNIFNRAEAILVDCDVSIQGTACKIEIGQGAMLDHVKIRMSGRHLTLRLGRGVYIGPGSVLWLEGEEGMIDIRDQTSIEQAGIAVIEQGTSIAIGENSMLAYGIDIRTSDSHGLYDQASGKRLNIPRDIILGSHVWVGSHVTILKGVTIGSGSVIGARSVVTHPVGDHCVAAGVPARVLRHGVVWTSDCANSLAESSVKQ